MDYAPMFIPKALHPMGLTDAGFVEHRRYLDYEYNVAASYPAALAAEPGLSCAEWERRNPYQDDLT